MAKLPENITKVHIHKFRKFENVEITLGSKVTAIAGKNGTMQTTLLGIIGQAFSMNDENNSMCSQKTVDGRLRNKKKHNMINSINSEQNKHLKAF